MTKCKSCGREFTPRRHYHRYCPTCWAERRQRHVPAHPRLRWLDEDMFIPWLIFVAAPALLIWLVGHLLGWW